MASFFIILEKSDRGEFNTSVRHSSFISDEKTGLSIVADARLDYRQELAGKLGLDPGQSAKLSDSRIILQAYLKWGKECLSHLYGDFTFVIWDPEKEKVFCARDQIGCRALYYVNRTEFLAIASEISAFQALPDFSFEMEEPHILNSLSTILQRDSTTAYRGIERLKPAHHIHFVQGKNSSQEPYWDLQSKPAFQALSLEEATRELKERFLEAVRERIPSSGPVGVELSGGLDSSGIAAVLAQQIGKEEVVNALTHSVSEKGAFPHLPQKSEMEFSRSLVEKYPEIRHFEITEEGGGGSFRSICEALEALHKPLNLHFALNSDLLYEKAASQGISIVFSGFGGDEGISCQGNGYFNELIRTAQHAKLRAEVKEMRSHGRRSYYKRLLKIYINYYLPHSLNPFKKDWRRDMYPFLAIDRELAREYRVKHKFLHAPSFPSKPDVRGMQYFRLSNPNIPERIEETRLLARQHSIEYRYPFLDVKLLEFFYSLPSEYKFRNGMGRYLFREAMKYLLPEKICLRTDKSGNTIPYVFARVLMDEDKFREVIKEGQWNNSFHYVDYGKLHEMLDLLKDPERFREEGFDLRSFQSAISVIILQKWQREGKVDVGIKC